MILFSDLHLRPDNADIIFGEVLPGILAGALKFTDRQHVVFLGDLLHVRYSVPVEILNGLHETWKEWLGQGVTIDLLPGNHDQIDVQGRHALEVFSEHTNVMVWTEPGWCSDGFFMPYRKDPDITRAVLTEALESKPPTSPKVLFYHGGILGALMNDSRASDEGLDLADLKPWAKVFCGHYHKYQELSRKKVIYIGSSWQSRSDEAGQTKGYCVWDGKKLERVPTNFGPSYHVFELEDGEEPDLTGVAKRDHVRIKTKGDAQNLAKALKEKGCDFVITPVGEEASTQRMELPPGAPVEAFVREYVQFHAGDLDPTKLMEIYEEVIA